MATSRDRVSFAEFFFIWAVEVQRWTVPDIHWRAVHWLENRGRLAVLRCFRGFGKSTILAVYNAWRYYVDPAYRILHQGDQDRTAHKTSRDTRHVLQRHPLTRDRPDLALRGEQSFWWISGNIDERNPSMQAAGITSNITSSRCEEAQNDDVEVPRNIQNPEAREKMRHRLGEQTHCMVPGARQLFIGTPHTHESLYDEMASLGADCLTIRMYAQEFRIENAALHEYRVPFAPDVVFHGIGKHTRELVRGRDYTIAGGRLSFKRPPGGMVDLYSGSAWPERFTPEEMLGRRKKCKTINEWDSQYQLHAKPIHEVRLNPDRMEVYDIEPTMRTANGEILMILGNTRLVGAAVRWDPAGGKLHSDVSALSVCFQDDAGRRYLHRVLALEGDVAQFADDGREIVGGQVAQICDVVEKFNLPRVTVETNGIGKFAPATLKAALKQRGLQCGVKEINETGNKNKRILEALEPLLNATEMLWVHKSVWDGPLPSQMRSWNPAVPQQPDDYLDATAGAVTETPERVGRRGEISPTRERQDWRKNAGVYEVLTG